MTDKLEEEIPVDITKLLGRGTTPEDIDIKCFELCQQYLGGVWLNLTIDEVVVERLRGGLTNQLYYCAVKGDRIINDAEEPQEVAVLLYGNKNFDNVPNWSWSDTRLTDTILALLISENGLGPKLYGLFEGGQIVKYYKHKSFRAEEQKDTKMIREVAQKLAHIHNMDVPIKRTGNLLLDFFDDTYKGVKEIFDLEALIDETNSETLKTYDIEEELVWLKKVIIDCDSPMTFTHSDFRGSNIMITESDGIVLIDFELSCYGYRGFDFGTIFCEWGRDWGEWDNPHVFPNAETFKTFIDSYTEESAKLKGNKFIDDNRNSLENILKEVKIFTLVGYMWIILFLLRKNESIIPEIPFNKLELMEITEKVYKNAYQECKQTLLSQHILQENCTKLINVLIK